MERRRGRREKKESDKQTESGRREGGGRGREEIMDPQADKLIGYAG